MVAGSDVTYDTTAELYSPPYLSQGKRPVIIGGVPEAVTRGQVRTLLATQLLPSVALSPAPPPPPPSALILSYRFQLSIPMVDILQVLAVDYSTKGGVLGKVTRALLLRTGTCTHSTQFGERCTGRGAAEHGGWDAVACSVHSMAVCRRQRQQRQTALRPTSLGRASLPPATHHPAVPPALSSRRRRSFHVARGDQQLRPL